MIFPWQQIQWEQLMYAKNNNHLAHALLLLGRDGLGKSHFAEELARNLLCQMNICSNDKPCHSCNLIFKKVHPNIRWIHPEKLGGHIKIDQIRELNEFIQQSTRQGNYRIVIINPAQQMTLQAANALLKTLEEPTAKTLIILISDQRHGLPATIISRCLQIVFKIPSSSEATYWLQQQDIQTEVSFETALSITQGAPLKALALLQTPSNKKVLPKLAPVRKVEGEPEQRTAVYTSVHEDSSTGSTNKFSTGVEFGKYFTERTQIYTALYKVAKGEIHFIDAALECEKIESIASIDFVTTWVLDIIRLKLGTQKIINFDWYPSLLEIIPHLSWVKCINWLYMLHKIRAQLISGINLNKQLLMEMILMEWKALC